MNKLHQLNRTGCYMETLCGMVLDADIRDRDHMLLATLDLKQEDVDLNFGEDAVICEDCQGKRPEEKEEEEDNLVPVLFEGILDELRHNA